MKKKLKGYTHEELLKMSNDRLSKLFDEENDGMNRKVKEFEHSEYANFSLDEKIKYFSGTLHQQMRWQVESGLDPYAIYNREWYESTKVLEPELDKIMDEVFAKYWGTGADWSKEGYLKRIKSEKKS